MPAPGSGPSTTPRLLHANGEIPPHRFTVFDNNAYKRAKPRRVHRIVTAERAQGISAMANVFVVQEMVAKIRDPTMGGVNRAAIKKLAMHCAVTTPATGTNVNFLSLMESQVYRLITGQQHPLDKEIYDTWGDLVRVVAQAAPDDQLSEIATDIANVEQMVDRSETQYIARVKAYATGPAQTNQMKRNLDYAARIAARTKQLYKREFTIEEVMQAIIPIAKISSLAFSLQDAIVEEMRRSGGGEAKQGWVADRRSVRGRSPRVAHGAARTLPSSLLSV